MFGTVYTQAYNYFSSLLGYGPQEQEKVVQRKKPIVDPDAFWKPRTRPDIGLPFIRVVQEVVEEKRVIIDPDAFWKGVDRPDLGLPPIQRRKEIAVRRSLKRPGHIKTGSSYKSIMKKINTQ